MKPGTTQKQWIEYQNELASHEMFIRNYKFYLNRICSQLDFISKGKTWTTEQIREAMFREIDKSESMDAPNEPGYYRANND